MSFMSSAKAIYVYSNQAAKDNVTKSETINQGVSGWTSLIWLINHKEANFPVDMAWKLPSMKQQTNDGLGFMSIMQAAKDGKLGSQAAYDELVRVNRLNKFHSKNVNYRFGQPVKIITLLAILIFVLFLLQKLIVKLKTKWKSIKTRKSSKSISFDTQLDDGSMQRSFLLLSTGMLLVSVLPLPYDYYTLLRLIVTTTAVMSAYHFYKINDSKLVVIFSFIALLFNPLIQIHLNKPLWLVIDISVAAYFYSVSKKIA